MKVSRLLLLTVFFQLSYSLTVLAESTPDELVKKGITLYAEKNYMEALVNLNKAIDLDKSYFKAYYLRGVIKAHFGDNHGAMKDFNESLELNPTFTEGYFERGNLKYSLQDYYGAISDYSEVINLNENHVEAYYKRGQAKHQLEAYSDAINDCSKIIEINPKNVDAFYLRGLLLIEHGQLEAGCLDLSKAGELGDLKAYEVIKERCNQKCFTGN
ncbi:tetratricopeptide repeat protein [Roseivirga sp. BDSF3-8]|uniref:tetratricopeptide repeat protein n=1 Tax=Roseivirga sp. BDSF3-8 TaxID=3241598 RepID=UPI0035322898